ncbi:MAG: LacI family DNA-binding transcriptional regulator [Spirochaetales bacterium]|nr:LacI family DNA-binding transcriptional regulator [Spirochaetales bacterium]
MTIKDIAKECGCAIGTVSRVLNEHPDVSDKTREKVLAVVQKHGFVLNSNAKQLKSQERKNIVVIVKGTSSPLLNSLLERLQKKFESLPYTVSVVVLDEKDDKSEKAVRLYYETKPVAFVFLGGNPDKYSKEFDRVKVPCVLISNEADFVESEYLSSVSIDNKQGAYCATKYLIEHGHKNIGIIGGTLDSEVSCDRYEGFLKAMKENNLSFDVETSYEKSKFSMEGGYSAVENLIEKNKSITAFFAMSDVMAMGACRKLNELGYRVPDDFSLVGFDGIKLGNYFFPRLTTIRQTEDELVEKGLDVLLNCIEKDSKAIHLHVPFEFIEGESVRKIN